MNRFQDAVADVSADFQAQHDAAVARGAKQSRIDSTEAALDACTECLAAVQDAEGVAEAILLINAIERKYHDSDDPLGIAKAGACLVVRAEIEARS